jgi:hypothetical protein
MDLQKMASEFAAAVMRVVQEATIDELTGNAPRVTARPWADVRQSTRRSEEGIPFGDGSLLEPSTGVRYWPVKKASGPSVVRKTSSNTPSLTYDAATVSALAKASKKKPLVKVAKKKPSPGTNVVATVSALGTTPKMRALRKTIAKAAAKKKPDAKVAKKVGPLSDDWKPPVDAPKASKVLRKLAAVKVSAPKKKAPLKKSEPIKRSHKKKVVR